MSNLIAFLVLFGILVFVHEFGHFFMAKIFKVGVEKFSLGYGTKVFGKRIGETEYVISALPLGGYVKMVGDEPADERLASEKQTELPENSFLAKPPWQRILIVLMGPIANLVLPVLLFFVLYTFGHPYLSTEVGYIGLNSPASKAGMKEGDVILAVSGDPVKEWRKLTKIIEVKAGQPTTFQIKRGDDVLDLKITPELTDGVNPFGEKIKVGKVGITPQTFQPVLHIPKKDSPAYRAGLRSEDLLLAADGKPFRYLWQLEETLRANNARQTILTVERGADHLDFPLDRSLLLDSADNLILARGGIYLRSLVIDEVLPDGIAKEKGLKSGDVVYALAGKPIPNWFTFQELIRENPGVPVRLTVVREGEAMDFEISPRLMEQTQEITGEKYKQRMLGITSRIELRTDNIKSESILNPVRSFTLSFNRCFEITRLTLIGFYKLISGKVSTKNLGGPILIYQLAGRSWKSGLHSFLNMVVLISITLGILNLLPIPVLDGGHLMFYTIELIQRRPVKARTREVAQQIGIIILVGLMLFAFYNDLGRISWEEISWVKWVREMFS